MKSCKYVILIVPVCIIISQEYVLTDVKDRQHWLTVHKKAKKLGFDVNKYNLLKSRIVQLENDLKKLRDPTKLPHIPLQRTSKESETVTGTDAKNQPKKES